MNNPPIRLAWTDFIFELQDRLHEKQVQTPMYIVGGAVRDAYRRGAIKDIDIAVDGDAVRVARHIADWFDGDVFVMDVERGVARVFVQTPEGQIVLDLANFRGETLKDDLRDRDFTINAMAADLLGDVSALIDPMNGQHDLNRKVLQRCTDHSIQDDPIRALRAIRQSVQLKLRIHPNTLEDIRENVAGLELSSFERVRDEFYNVLGTVQPSRGLRVLQHLGMMTYVIEDIDALVGLEQNLPHRFDGWNHTLLVIDRMNSILKAISYKRTDNTAATFDLGMLVIQLDRYRSQLQAHIFREYGTGRTHQQLMILGALVHNLGKTKSLTEHIPDTQLRAKIVAESLRLTNDEQKKLVSMVGAYRDVLDKPEWTTLDLHRFWFTLRENGIDAILLGVADYLGMVGAELEQSEWLVIVERVIIMIDTYFNQYETIVNPTLYLNGNDIMEMLGLEGSPMIGRLLTLLREAQVTGDISSIENARDFIKLQYDSL